VSTVERSPRPRRRRVRDAVVGTPDLSWRLVVPIVPAGDGSVHTARTRSCPGGAWICARVTGGNEANGRDASVTRWCWATFLFAADAWSRDRGAAPVVFFLGGRRRSAFVGLLVPESFTCHGRRARADRCTRAHAHIAEARGAHRGGGARAGARRTARAVATMTTARARIPAPIPAYRDDESI